MYWENRENPDYQQMDAFNVPMEKYIFLERGGSHLSKNT